MSLQQPATTMSRLFPIRACLAVLCSAMLLREASGFVVPTSPRVAAVSLRGVTMKAGGDLLIIGAGTLGERLTKQYKAQYPKARVVACTNTTKRHDTLRALGAEPTLSVPSTPFHNVAYFVTPNAKNFLELCQQGLHAWQGPGDDGSFLFSSSVGVFAKNVPEGTRISETHATNASASSFSRTLVTAEELVLGAGGSVMRIAGMYNLRKNRNSFFLKGGNITRRADAFIGLVAYDDVVDAAIKMVDAPAAKTKGQVFIVADGHEQTVESCFANGHPVLRFLGEDPLPFTFTGVEPTRGVLYDNSKLREVLGWQPTYASFQEYCQLILQGAIQP